MISVEGGLEVRRAGLAASMAAAEAEIPVLPWPAEADRSGPDVTATGPYRPRPRVLEGPQGSTVDRIRQLTGAGEERAASQVVEAEAAEAAEIVLRQLRSWGYIH